MLLTSAPPSETFIVEHIEDLRAATDNQLIWAEQVDLSSLHSIRMFATKWIDNAPPRRLDMIILCAATMTPRFASPILTKDGLEPNWGINFLANFHLLSILSPALRAQPSDRDVRVLVASCASYAGGELKNMRDSRSPLAKGREYETSKLALIAFARAFQKHLDVYARPDKQPNNTRVILVDPGLCRTPGTRRWLSGGHLLGLLLYVLMWPLWWLFLKSSEMGAESFLYAAMEGKLGRGGGGKLLKECRETEVLRDEVEDERVQEELWKFSEAQIKALEKEGAFNRAIEKKMGERRAAETGRLEKRDDGKLQMDREGNGQVVPATAVDTRNQGSRRSRKGR